MEHLQNLTILELKSIAKDKGITINSKAKKNDIIQLIKNQDDTSPTISVDDSSLENELENKTTPKKVTDLFVDKNNSISGGVLEILPDGYGFLRGGNYLSTENDVYMSPTQIRRFKMKTGDYIEGVVRPPKDGDRFKALLYVHTINKEHPEQSIKRNSFDNLTPLYPQKKFNLDNSKDISSRLIDMIAPIGKGQRGLIVAPPKAGKTTLIKCLANSIKQCNPEVEMIILLIDERPEEVTDIKNSVQGADVIYSTFDELPSNHVKVAEMVLNRAKGLVEFKKDVVVLLDSITRLARAYNITIQSSGKILSGGLDPSSLYGPKKFFGAARNVKEGGSLTILATTLVDTGSRMDDVIFEEFKGTGNMELTLDRNISQKRIFPAIDIEKSGTRKDELLHKERQIKFSSELRKNLDINKNIYLLETLINLMNKKSNDDIINSLKL